MNRAAKAALVALLGLAACAPIPPPSILGKLDQLRATPASKDAEKHAPSAFAHAEMLRKNAFAALDPQMQESRA